MGFIWVVNLNIVFFWDEIIGYRDVKSGTGSLFRVDSLCGLLSIGSLEAVALFLWLVPEDPQSRSECGRESCLRLSRPNWVEINKTWREDRENWVLINALLPPIHHYQIRTRSQLKRGRRPCWSSFESENRNGQFGDAAKREFPRSGWGGTALIFPTQNVECRNDRDEETPKTKEWIRSI